MALKSTSRASIDAARCASLPPDGEVLHAVGKVGRCTLEQKVALLRDPAAYGNAIGPLTCRETHMSFVFIVDDRAYKLKKPVRFPYLDFSTLARRESACRAELALNRRLAPDIYLAVTPLVLGPHGLSIGGEGRIVDWLVVMRRLDEAQMLENVLLARGLRASQLDRLIAVLVQFYRRAAPVFLAPAVRLRDWQRSLDDNRKVLLDPHFGLNVGLVRQIDAIQRRFVAVRKQSLARRRLVNGHGDLRPEHIWLGSPIKIIDCLEFNPRLRAVDPFDEIAFLTLECERLGAPWAGEYIRRGMARALRDGLSAELFVFYRCHRAMLRARLAIAHLFETNPRTPARWTHLARSYLRLAARDARRLERFLRRQAGR